MMIDKEYFSLGNSTKSVLGKKQRENIYDFEYKKENFDINDKSNSHSVVASLIEEKKYVLDVGCSSGKMGHILKDLKKCKLDGIEYDKIAFNLAKKSGIYKNIYNFSICDEKNKKYLEFFQEKEKYDYIIFADVLEHIVDPCSVLENFSKKLKRNGKIIISIPNIANIDIIKGLINSKFNYNEIGILDSTHVRFFTQSSFIDMIDNLSSENRVHFNIDLCEKVIVPPAYINNNRIYDVISSSLKNNDLYALQNVFQLSLVSSQNDRKKFEITTDDNAFIKIDKFIDDLYQTCDTLSKKCESLNLKNDELNNLLQEKQNEQKESIKEKEKLELELLDTKEKLNKILASKRWRIINKLFNILPK